MLTQRRNERKRFNFLCLSEGELYYESYRCSESGHFGSVVDGQLHHCSHSLIFVPERFEFPLIKLRFSNVGPTCIRKHQISDTRSAGIRISCTEFTELKHRNKPCPYIRVKPSSPSESRFLFVLHHTRRRVFLDRVLPNLTLWHRYGSNHLKVVEQLHRLYRETQEDQQFDITYIEDFRERTIFESHVIRVKPLVEIRGTLVLTDRRLYFQPFHTLGKRVVKKIDREKILRCIARRYLLRPVGVELFLGEGSYYFVFEGKENRDSFVSKICCGGGSGNENETENETENESMGLADVKEMTRKWQYGTISNFDYLLYLNFLSDRSFNDLTQYPVFPWILKDYTSSSLDFGSSSSNSGTSSTSCSSEETFRDLSQPIGALNETRLQRLLVRYREMPEPKYFYGTHYSSPYFILYYLMRSAPEYMLRLQSGKFDHPDRLFHSVGGTWEGVMTNHSDVKELIPEFYQSTGRFLRNSEMLELGSRSDGSRVDHVVLPPWARDDPKEFIYLNRLALESNYVSRNLHSWIDLIFGYKQRGKPAEEAHNVFHWLTYEGSINFEEIRDRVERNSRLAQVREFGQTPKQIFLHPHPRRVVVDVVNVPSKADVTSSDVVNFGVIFGEGAVPLTDDAVSSPSPSSPISIPGSGKRSRGNSPAGDTSPASLSLSTSASAAAALLSSSPADRDVIAPADVPLHGFVPLHSAKVHREVVSSVVFGPKDRLYTTSHDSTLLIYSLARNRRIRKINRFGDMALSGCVPVSDDATGRKSKNIVVASWNNSIYMYSVGYGRLLSQIQGHEDAVSCVRVHSGQRRILSTSWDGLVKVWDLTEDCRISDLPVGQYDEHASDEVQCGAFSPSGQLLASADKNGTVVVIDQRAGKPVACPNLHDESVSDLLFLDETTFLSCSEDTTIHVHTINVGDITIFQSDHPLNCLMSWEGVVVSGNSGGIIETWDLKNSGTCLLQLSDPSLRSGVVSLDWREEDLSTGTSSRLASGHLDGKIVVWGKQ